MYLHSPSARENTTLLVKYLAIFHSYSCNKSYWVSEASPTLGCSIEISRDICNGYGDRRRKKSKIGEDGSYRTAHVSPDYRCGQYGQYGCGFVPQTHSEKLATMLIIQT